MKKEGSYRSKIQYSDISLARSLAVFYFFVLSSPPPPPPEYYLLVHRVDWSIEAVKNKRAWGLSYTGVANAARALEGEAPPAILETVVVDQPNHEGVFWGGERGGGLARSIHERGSRRTVVVVVLVVGKLLLGILIIYEVLLILILLLIL